MVLTTGRRDKKRAPLERGWRFTHPAHYGQRGADRPRAAGAQPRGPRDLRVAVKAISVNPVDVKIRASAIPPKGEVRILGFDAAGVVESVGSNVTLFKPGDEVFYAGALHQ